MNLHYCDIFSDCFHCPSPFCPYEKLDDWGQDGQDEIDDEDLDEDEEEGW